MFWAALAKSEKSVPHKMGPTSHPQRRGTHQPCRLQVQSSRRLRAHSDELVAPPCFVALRASLSLGLACDAQFGAQVVLCGRVQADTDRHEREVLARPTLVNRMNCVSRVCGFEGLRAERAMRALRGDFAWCEAQCLVHFTGLFHLGPEFVMADITVRKEAVPASSALSTEPLRGVRDMLRMDPFREMPSLLRSWGFPEIAPLFNQLNQLAPVAFSPAFEVKETSNT